MGGTMGRVPINDRDRQALTRRRALLSLPMVPLRHRSLRDSRGLPEWAGWKGEPAAIGFGPEGDRLDLYASADHADRARIHPVGTSGRDVDLDGALRARWVQPLPGGHTLLVGARGRDQEGATAQVWDGEGHLVASAFIGNCFEHVLTTSGGSIWLGYFDEAGDELGLRKLVRLGPDLRPEWWYPFPSEQPGLPDVFDVFALNVVGESAYCYAYTDYHLIRVEGDEVVDLGPAGVLGANAVVIDGERGAFIGGYGPEHDVITPFTVGPDGVRAGDPVGRLVPADSREAGLLRLTTRGPDLHAVTTWGSVYGITLEELLDGERF